VDRPGINANQARALRLSLAAALVVFLLLPFSPVHALDPSRELTQYAIDVWTTDDGLPLNGVVSLAQTADGYLWVGTQSGLARFDGLAFTVFDVKGTGVLQEDYIESLLGDSRGNLWIGTIGGLYRYADGIFTAYDGEENPAHRIVKLFEDSLGRIWVGVRQEPVRVIEDGQLRVFRDGEGKTLEGVDAITETPDGTICMSTVGIHCLRDGLFRAVESSGFEIDEALLRALAIHEGKFVAGTSGAGVALETAPGTSNFRTVSGTPHGIVTSIEIDRHGELWVATFGGLARVRQSSVQTLTVEDGLTHPSIEALIEDHEGSLWLGTNGGGLIRLRDRQLGTLSVEDGLASAQAQAVLQDGGGFLWLASSGGNLQRYRNGEWRSFGPEDGLPRHDINALWEGEPGTLWVGTGEAGIFRFRDHRFESVPSNLRIALAGIAEADGTVWAGGPNGVQLLQGGQFVTPDWARDLRRVSALHRDREGTLWIGTFGLGLTSYRDGRLETFTTDDGLSSNNILGLHEDEDDVLWIVTYGGGLIRLRDGVFHAITTKEGLPRDEIYRVLEDDHGRLWMSTPAGIAVVSRDDLNALAAGTLDSVNSQTFGTADGMRNAECNGGFQPAGWKTRDGKLWFPTVDGFVTIDPARMAENRPPPAVVVEQVTADGRTLETGDRNATVVVPPGRGNLEFRYTGLSFLDSGSIRFRYLLDGFDEGWTEVGTRRTAYYTNVPPGRYTFRVNACNNAGSWNETDAVVSLRVRPHYYQSPWFFGVCALVLGLALYGLHRYRVRRILELERVRTRIATDLHDDIGSSLSQIAILSEVVRHRVATGGESLEQPLSQIAESSRELVDSMSDIVWAINPKRDNLDDLVYRMRRFASDTLAARNIAFTFEAPSEESTLALGPDLRRELYLVFKECIHNAVKHSECERVEVALKVEGGRLILAVKDDGRGFDPGQEVDGHGLASMARRAERLGGAFQVDSATDQGTTVTLEVPLSGKARRN